MKYFNTKFFELSKGLYVAVNLKNELIELAGPWEKHLGWRHDELLEKNFLTFVFPHDLEKTLESFTTLRIKKERKKIQYRFINKNGLHSLMYMSLDYDLDQNVILGTIDGIEINNDNTFLESLINHSPTLISFIDNDLNYKYINKSFELWFGIESQDYIEEGIHLDDQNILKSSLRPYMEEALLGEKQNIELITPDPKIDNAYKILNIDIVPNNTNEIVNGLFIFITDITELKTNASAAIEKEKKLQTLFDNLSQGVVLQDNKNRVIEFNPSALRILGLTKDQFLGKTSYDPSWKIVSENNTPMTPEEHPAMIAIKSGVSVHDKLMGIYKSATEIVWISVTAIPLFETNESKPYKVLVTFEDLTKTMKLKQELKLKSSWKAALLDGADYSLISTNSEGLIITFNKKAEELLGYKAYELVNRKTPMEFHDLEEVTQRAKELTHELKQPVQVGFETFVVKALKYGKDIHRWTYITKKGERVLINLQVTAMRDEKNSCIGFLGMATKIN